MSTCEEWEAWGERDPYFGVLAHDRFRRSHLNEASLEDFFRSGREEVEHILADARAQLGALSLARTLDFGCGVGRMLIPLAQQSGSAVGVDVSAAMRAEAERNCTRFQVGNVRLVGTLEELPAAETFTFVHSYIVMQHIPHARGLRIIAALLERLAPGGALALHLTYGRRRYAYNLGRQTQVRRVLRAMGLPWKIFLRRVRRGDPHMLMNLYDVNRVLFLLQRHGVRGGGFRFTDHSGNLGVILFARRPE